MKFKSNIEIQAGLEDASGSPGAVNQLLSSTVTGTAWIDPATIVAEAATLVVIACKNTSGAAIAQGTPVYQTGTVGATATIEIAPADALISANKLPAIGLLQTALNNNGSGFVVITGELTHFTTSPIDGVVPTPGDKLFVKSGGGLTLTKPTGEGNGIQNMGLVGRVSGGNSGSITVSSIMRTNDVPNLPEGRIWVGDGNTLVSDTVYVDEPNLRLGIGTTSPSEKLTVLGVGSFGTSTSQTLVDYDGLNAVGNTDYIRFKVDNSEKLRITSTGNVGIGTTSPSMRLDIRTNGVNDGLNLSTSQPVSFAKIFNGNSESFPVGNLKLGYGSNSTAIIQALSNRMSLKGGYTTGGQISFLSASTEVMRMTSTGLGIGTTSPGAKLEVVGDIKGDTFIATGSTPDTSTISLGVYAGGAWLNTPSGTAGYLGAGGSGVFKWNASSVVVNEVGADFDFRVESDIDTHALFVNGGTNNVGIGTSTPESKLQVAGGIQMADDTDTASAAKVGTLKYRVSGNNSYVDMCMQTGATTYAWINIVQNNW